MRKLPLEQVEVRAGLVRLVVSLHARPAHSNKHCPAAECGGSPRLGSTDIIGWSGTSSTCKANEKVMLHVSKKSEEQFSGTLPKALTTQRMSSPRKGSSAPGR